MLPNGIVGKVSPPLRVLEVLNGRVLIDHLHVLRREPIGQQLEVNQLVVQGVVLEIKVCLLEGYSTVARIENGAIGVQLHGTGSATIRRNCGIPE